MPRDNTGFKTSSNIIIIIIRTSVAGRDLGGATQTTIQSQLGETPSTSWPLCAGLQRAYGEPEVTSTPCIGHHHLEPAYCSSRTFPWNALTCPAIRASRQLPTESAGRHRRADRPGTILHVKISKTKTRRPQPPRTPETSGQSTQGPATVFSLGGQTVFLTLNGSRT
ncbi:uncharacterized protein B0I36DRAFT_317698 [Microdochium trichocladiopsis]|uniref:Uncharacterized protein n=1 Tax=Microdochium trichocladiopsis TaxID=1682393 RepID=A0A9P9BSS0_9PEZI|nr:uncharacterized protein B0I36DRAFT_317698 [Microdochium trichocladiopsis]KAH7035130.1 hypothetical protein B0I36DRAFT_317698 [Microdochium trichocladiopsis]